MKRLSDLTAGDQFMFIAKVTSVTPQGITLDFYGPSRTKAASVAIASDGTFTGGMVNTPDQVPVTIVTGFVPIAVGDVVTSDRTGETMVARSAWISDDGQPMWSNTLDAQVVYPASGWVVVGHMDL